MRDRISIIIPTRNEAQHIRTFLAAIPASVELVIVDASDDATPEMIAALRPDNTQIIRSDVHIAAARQLGAAAATGDWLLFSDADVCFEPGYFDRIARYLDSAACYGPKRAMAHHQVYSTFFNRGQQVLHAIGIPAASGSNMAIRREILEAAGGFRDDLSVNEDTELCMRLAALGYQITYAPDLAVLSIDDRRLDRGSIRKMAHSLARCALLLASFYVPLPHRLLRHDWGYWRASHTRLAE